MSTDQMPDSKRPFVQRTHDEHDKDCVTVEEARALAMEAADVGSTLALKRTFALLGIDLDDFESVQEWRGDLQWIRSGRRVSKTITSKSISSVVGVISIAVVIGFYDWIKAFIIHLKP